MQPQCKDIAIYGAGGLGREVASMLKYIDSKNTLWNLVGFFDDGKPVGTPIDHYGPVLGGMEKLNSWSTPICVAICMGNPNTVANVAARICNPLVEFPNLIVDDMWISDSNTFTIGRGNIIQGCCVATVGVTLGDFNILNGSVTLGHDVTIGNCNVIMPGSRISGEVNIADRCLIGAASFIRQQLRVPDGGDTWPHVGIAYVP